MSDRVSVKVVILSSFKEAFEKIIDREPSDDVSTLDEKDSNHPHPILESYLFYEVDGGDLAFQNLLDESKIPFSKYWETGSTFDGGELHVRIDSDGNLMRTEFDNGMKGFVEFHEAVDAFDSGRMGEFIKNHKEKYNVIPWIKQYRILHKES